MVIFYLLLLLSDKGPYTESDTTNPVSAVSSIYSEIKSSVSQDVSISSSPTRSVQQIALQVVAQTCSSHVEDTLSSHIEGTRCKRPREPESKCEDTLEKMEAVAFAEMDESEGGVFIRDILIQNPRHVHLNPVDDNSTSIIYNFQRFLSLLETSSSIRYCERYYEKAGNQVLFVKDTVFYNILQFAALFSSETEVIVKLKEQKSFIRWKEVENDLKKLTEDEIEQLCADAEAFSAEIQEAIYGPSYSNEAPFNYSGPWGPSEKTSYTELLEYKRANNEGFVLLLVEVF